MIRVPRYRPQYTVVDFIGTPKNLPPSAASPPSVNPKPLNPKPARSINSMLEIFLPTGQKFLGQGFTETENLNLEPNAIKLLPGTPNPTC